MAHSATCVTMSGLEANPALARPARSSPHKMVDNQTKYKRGISAFVVGTQRFPPMGGKTCPLFVRQNDCRILNLGPSKRILMGMDQKTFQIPRQAATLRTMVEDRLRTAILTGHFETGQRLVERELCELFGVGRTSVREALRQLEAEGLVTTVPHKGPTAAG